MSGILVGLIAALIPMTILVELVSIGTLFAFALVCISVIVLRRTQPTLYRPFRCPWVPYIPLLGAAVCILLMLSLPYTNWIRLLGWLIIGLCLYFGYGRRHARNKRK